jgi:hypothetical protein
METKDRAVMAFGNHAVKTETLVMVCLRMEVLLKKLIQHHALQGLVDSLYFQTYKSDYS